MNNNLLVYKASAGSGKTYTLSAEYIARLLCGTPDTYRHILAVTFTNKATAEMKERILQYLWELGYTDTDFKEKIQEIAPRLTDEQIRTKAQTALKAIVHDYDHFRVEIIDSFFQSLLSNLAHELGLTANFKVNINDKEVIEKSVDKMMKEIENTPEALAWVLDYIEERISEGKKWDISRDIKKLGNNLLKEKLLRAEEQLRLRCQDQHHLRRQRGSYVQQGNGKDSAVKFSDAHPEPKPVRGVSCLLSEYAVYWPYKKFVKPLEWEVSYAYLCIGFRGKNTPV